MKRNYIKRVGCAGLFSLLLIVGNACTNLDEEVFQEITTDNYYNNAEEIIAAYLSVYAPLQDVYEENYFNIVEFSTDEASRPTKVAHGYDGGQWIRYHRHEWLISESRIRDVWDKCYKGIGFVNSNIENFDKLDFSAMNVPMDKGQMYAEMRAMRAFYYYMLCDLFGGVPLVEKVGEPVNPKRSTRTETFDYVEKEINAVLLDLPQKGDKNSYGKMTQGAALSILAKLYLNAEEWTGTARWDDCIRICDEIINSGKYKLDPTWQYPFRYFNEDSEENIFVIPYDQLHTTEFNYPGRCLHYSHQQKYKMVATPSNGIVTEIGFYSKFKPNDKRSEQWLVGLQLDFNGDTLYCNQEKSGQPLILNPEVISMELGNEDSGVRNVKFEIQIGTRNGNDNDLPVTRYADVLMMKAECLLRIGKKAQALDLINEVRARSFDENDPNRVYTDITMDEFLDERAREFAYECWRRQDLIRFGKFNDAWWDKKASDPTRKLFPIPENRIMANPSLEQNPGY